MNKTEDNSVEVIFTGLVRAPEKFKHSITDLIMLREKGLVDKITFST